MILCKSAVAASGPVRASVPPIRIGGPEGAATAVAAIAKTTRTAPSALERPGVTREKIIRLLRGVDTARSLPAGEGGVKADGNVRGPNPARRIARSALRRSRQEFGAFNFSTSCPYEPARMIWSNWAR